MSLLFASSSSDLNVETIKKLGIECIKYPYKKDDKLHFFDEDFDFGGFYSKVKKNANFDCAYLSTEDFVKVFEPCFEQGDDIIYVHSSAKIIDSTSICEAKKILEDKYKDRKMLLIDSKNISIGEGVVAYLCALLYRKGNSLKDIEEKSLDIINESAFFFATNNTNKLEKNNLISSNYSTGGTALNIKPIWTLNIDGEIELFDKVSGKKKCISRLLEIIRQMGENVADFPIEIVYTIDENSANELKSKILDTYGNETSVNIERMTPNNSMLLGEDLLGLSFHIHRKIH